MEPRLSRQQRRAAVRRSPNGNPIPLQSREESLAEKWAKRRLPSIMDGAETFLLQLPSGDEARARRIPVPALLTMGQLPNRLLPTLLEWTEAFRDAIESGGGENEVATAINRVIARDPKPYVEVAGITWRNCIVDPITVLDEEFLGVPGTIPMAWVQLQDLEFVFDWAQGVDESVVDFFRRRQAQGVAMAQASEGTREAPGGDCGDRQDEQPVADAAVE